MRISKKTTGYSALAVVVLLALIILALPPLIKHIAVQKIDEATGRKSQIAKITLNPFTLSAGISGVRLSEKGSEVTFFSLSSARLSLSPLSLPKRSFIITELHLASPYLHVVRNAPNNFNFTDLLTGGKKREKSATPLFSVNNITLDRGSIDFQDKALKVEKLHRLRNMKISVPFVSNMPYLAERYVAPHFSAVVNDSPFIFEGRLKPLTKAVEATLALNVKQIDLPYYLGYVPFPLPVKVVSGLLTTAVDLNYRVDEKTGPEAWVTGTIALDHAAVREPNGAPLASIDRAQLKIKEIAAYARKVDLSSLELDGTEVYASRDHSGVWNFQKLTSGNKAEPAKNEPPAANKRPVDLKLAKLSFRGGKFHFSDAVPKAGFKTDLHDIELSMEHFATATGQKAPFDFKFRSARGESLQLKGEFAPSPVEVKGNLALTGLPLKDYYPYLADTLTAPVSGTLGLSSDFLFNDAQGLVIEKTALKGEGLAAPFGKGEGFRLREALISGIKADLKKSKASVEKAELKGGDITLSSEKGGAVSAQRLLKQQPATTKAKGRASAASKRGANVKGPSPFDYRVEKVVGSDFKIRYTDRNNEEAPQFALNGMNFSLARIAGPKQGPIPFTLTSGYSKLGRIKAAGDLTPSPFRFKGNVELHRIPLRDFDAYVPEDTTIFIADGALDTKLSLNLEQGASGIKGSFTGAMGIHSFYCLDTVLDEDLLKWERLQLDRLSGTLGPFSLTIADVSLSNFYSRVIVEKDGTLNLQHLVREEPQGAQAKGAVQAAQAPPGAPVKAPSAAPVKAPLPVPAKAPAATAPAATAPVTTAPVTTAPTTTAPTTTAPTTTAPTTTAPTTTAPAAKAQATAAPGALAQPAAPQPHPIRIDSVTVQGGTLDFSDRHLEAPFDTTFFNLGGRVSGLSSQSNKFANVDLRGNLGNHSPLTITGVINPLRGDLYLDLKIAFNDIELSPFTPYTNTYLGYMVDKGKLYLDLTYRIDKKTLSSQNKVFIDQFSFGKAVESSKATKLPVRLAIALLKDSKGEIHLDLPVAGRTDDPKFSVWGVVLQILKNLLVKAATSPFALLSSMFGGTEDFSAVYFAPGSTQLSKPEQDKLLKLSQALQQRPALNMEISGFVDREQDAEGYRNEMLLKKMKGEKFRTLVKQGKTREGQTQEETEILPQEYPVYLKAVYVKEKFPKPRNALGFLKDLPEGEMKKLIIAHTMVGNNELQALARERAEAVKTFLQKEGKTPAERLFEKSADIYKPGTKEGVSGSRVEFGASVK